MAKNTKLAQILDLEKTYDIILKPVRKGEDIMNWHNRNTYLLNDKNEIIGLNLSKNKINDISHIKELKLLTQLNLGYNQINDISHIKELKLLTLLRLNNNKINDISHIKELKLLTQLNLSDNQINDISHIKKLKLLTQLNLSDNQIKDISQIKELKQLTQLDLSFNQIDDISRIKELKQLTQLELYSNQINDISHIKELKQLTQLDISYNQINDISHIEELKQLIYLNLSYNQINDISHIKELKQLRYLNLRDNQINDISYIKELKLLTDLNLQNNQINKINSVLGLLKQGVEISESHYTGIALGYNPLQTPPMDIVKEGREAVIRYLEKISEEGSITLKEAKVTLVGDGSAGKTSLIRRLLNPKADLPEEKNRTRGITIEDWEFKKQANKKHIAHIWDFGGQDVYYPVHRFFLTENSVFVLMASSRQNTHNFDYWIPTIFQFGGKSPIILGQTCHEGNIVSWNDIGAYMASDNFNIIKDHEKNYHEINLTNGNKGLAQIKKSIINQILSLPHYKKNVPSSWVPVRDLVAELKLQNCISYIDLKSKIQTLNPTSFATKEDVEDCIHFLHSIGILLWYSKELKLRHWVILNPKWAVDAVYKIIDDEKILNQNGIIYHKDFDRVWKDKMYDDKHDILKEMLAVFKISFPKKTNQTDYIIPTRLQSIPSNKIWNAETACLCLEFHFEFMPKGMVNQISAELSRYIVSDEEIWNNAVNFIYNKATSQVFEDFLKRKIIVKAKENDARGIMLLIIDAVTNISNEYKGVEPKISIPCPCNGCKTDPVYYNYNQLLTKLEKNNKAIVTCNVSDTQFEINDLLFTTGLPNPIREREKEEERMKMKTIKIFLASSLELEDDRKEFRQLIGVENDRLHEKGIYLKLVQWEYYIDDISDSRLQDKYNKEVAKCEIALCLFFTKVGKFTEEEFDTAYYTFKAKGTPLIWTYFKHAAINTKNITPEINTVINFQDKLIKLGHFQSSYESVPDLFLKFKRQLELKKLI